MYKTELVRQVAKETRLSQRLVSDVVNATLEQVTAVLVKKGEIRLPGFGVFYTRQRAAFKVRSVRSGRPVEVPSHRVAGFRVGDLLKRAVWKKRPGKHAVPKSTSGEKLSHD